MKHFKNLYPKIYDYENLHRAYLSARKNKRYRSEVLAFSANLEENLIELQNELIYHSYKVGRYREFYVSEPKRRLVMALPFRDRVLQWAVYRIVNPLFSRAYISDSYACIPGRGEFSAIQRLHYWLRLECKAQRMYYLKLDMAKFYYRVDHKILLELLSKKIDDSDLMQLLRIIIESEDTPFGLPLCGDLAESARLFDIGIPIGNLTSQMFANLYMNELDQFAKRTLRIGRYIRYMDDIIILSPSKELLHHYKIVLEKFINEKLHLELNKKTAIRPCSLGVDFCGYKIWPDHIKVRKSTALRMKRHLKLVTEQYAEGRISLEKANQSFTSYFGLLKHCNSYQLRKKISKTYILKRKNNSENQKGSA